MAADGATEDASATGWDGLCGWKDGRGSGFCAGVAFLLFDGYGGSVSRPKPRPTAEAPSRVALAASWYHGNASVLDLCNGRQRSRERVGQAGAALGRGAVKGVESKTEQQCKETGGLAPRHSTYTKETHGDLPSEPFSFSLVMGPPIGLTRTQCCLLERRGHAGSRCTLVLVLQAGWGVGSTTVRSQHASSEQGGRGRRLRSGVWSTRAEAGGNPVQVAAGMRWLRTRR